MPAPHANPESPANSAAREMLEMQLQQAQEVLKLGNGGKCVEGPAIPDVANHTGAIG